MSVYLKLLKNVRTLFRKLSNREEDMMSDVEFEVTLEEDEELFEDEAEKRFMEEFAPEPKPVPKKEFISTKAGLAELARKAKAKKMQESYEKKVLKNPSENFKKQVKVLADHIIEWCNYEASQGNYSHTYDISKSEEIYFAPVLKEVRHRMKSVIILVEEKKRRLTIEWGSNER